MNFNHIYIWAAVACTALFTLSACKKDKDDPKDPPPPSNEPEQITSVEIHFKEVSGSSHVMVKWSDPDGNGGNSPEIDSILLDSNTVYEAEISFLDESGSDAKNLSAEIRDEGDEHFICFDAQDENLANNLSIALIDSDGNLPIGLHSEWTTASATSGEIKLMLKHQPDGLKDGTCEPGDTDVEVYFPMRIR